ncbi:sensor histidine kinase [Actinoplanes sp. CA-142083]|uniref:sensor histidine kinase n=1 Tax=Actinoplanes sp. CA-142083 TaxID=3239903 RepID=UPI003D8AEF79
MTRLGRTLAGVAVGVLTAVGEALFLVLAGLAFLATAPVPRLRRRVRPALAALAVRAADAERRRLALPAQTPEPRPATASPGPATAEPAPAAATPGAPTTPAPRAIAYLAARLIPGALGALTCGLLLIGLILAGIVITSLATGDMSVPDALLQALIGSALLVINLQAIGSVAALDRRLAHRLLDTSDRELLRRRIDELTTSRAGVIAAVDAERARIERDLHDGLQQRLVALGMLLGRARRAADPQRARDLLTQAHEDAQRAIDDLREVAWRVYPSALEHSTLDEVLTMVAQRSALPVTVRYDLAERPPRPVETVLYFVACEAVTNAAKHANATVVEIEIAASATGVGMLVRDDGHGGADPDGRGLHGLARRVTALDGRFEVDSPPGGPTLIRAELPCG